MSVDPQSPNNGRGRRLIRLGVLILVMALGSTTGSALFLVAGHGHRVPSFGSYNGYVFYRLYFMGDRFVSVRLEGQTSPKWHWAAPTNYHYETLGIEWDTSTESKTGRVKTSPMVLEIQGQDIAVSRESLAELIFAQSFDRLPVGDSAGIDYLFTLLEQARNGTLPEPRHHSRFLESPLGGRGVHFSLGLHIPYSIVIWSAFWIAVCLLLFLKPITPRS